MTARISLPVTDLDQQLDDELQPGCDAGQVPCGCDHCQGRVTDFHACPLPARWIVTARWCRGAKSRAVCDVHADEAEASLAYHRCSRCRQPPTAHREPLS